MYLASDRSVPPSTSCHASLDVGGPSRRTHRTDDSRRRSSRIAARGTTPMLAVALALVASAPASDAAARTRPPAGATTFPAAPDRRTSPLGPLGGDPRAATDRALRAVVIEALQRDADEPRWHLRPVRPGRWVASEDGAGFFVDANGVVLVPAPEPDEARTPSVRLRTVAVGRAGAWLAVPPTIPGVRGHEAVYGRPSGWREIWRHGPLGMEQLFVVERRPEGDGPMRIVISLRGELRVRHGDHRLQFVDRAGRVRGHYADPFARDARGRSLPIELAASSDGRRFELRVDDRDAVYPLLVDPIVWARQAKLTTGGASGTTMDYFGTSVALSADASRALVGAPASRTGRRGVAYVFVRTGASWSQEARLELSDGPPGDFFGAAVALSDDGARALVGAPNRQVGGVQSGAAYLFSRVTSRWSQEAQLVPSSPADLDEFGASVALSGNGERALVGAPRDDVDGNRDVGSAWIYSRASTGWALEATLAPAGSPTLARFATAVALSQDGATAAIGAPGNPSGTPPVPGSVTMWRRSASTPAIWSQTAVLEDALSYVDAEFGQSVAMSADASRVLVGARFADLPLRLDVGAAVIFASRSGTWSAATTLIPSDGSSGDAFGGSVALASAGDIAWVGAPGRSRGLGAVYVYEEAAGRWSETALVTASSPEGGFGASLDGSTDAGWLLVGVPSDDVDGVRDRGSVVVLHRGLDQGEPCRRADDCGTTHCVDGVCCNEACGGGRPDDCEACATSAGALRDGTCTALRPDFAAGVVCRPAAGDCDAAETCGPDDRRCPRDLFATPMRECRPARGPCDAAEYCTGTHFDCPADAFLTGTLCRAPEGDCDVAEYCSGSGPDCPPNAYARDVPCRASRGLCDVEERCTGSSPHCPTDGYEPDTTVCRPAASECDVAERCPGTGPHCPTDAYAPATTPCGPPPSGVCDAPDRCSGTSGDCVAVFLSGAECRPSRGGCDPAELCSGTAPDCPPDQVSPAGTVCRESTDLSCDPLESCDGARPACPADVNTCIPSGDAGVSPDSGALPEDAGAGSAEGGVGTDAGTGADGSDGTPDAASTADAARPVPASAGCGCRTSGIRKAGILGAALALALLAFTVRRRSRAVLRP